MLYKRKKCNHTCVASVVSGRCSAESGDPVISCSANGSSPGSPSSLCEGYGGCKVIQAVKWKPLSVDINGIHFCYNIHGISIS